MKTFLVLALLTFVLQHNEAVKLIPPTARFDDFKVYKVIAEDEAQLNDFKKLGNYLPISYLNEIRAPGSAYDILVNPADQDALEATLKHYELRYEVIIDNLQDALEGRKTAFASPLEWTQYHSLDDIYAWVDQISQRYSSIIEPYIIGYSYEGRPIKALKISRKPGNKAVFIEANIHAIEWISSATTTCFFNKLITATDGELYQLTLDYDWVFVPVVNPDGLEYTHNVHPLWRKNRRPNGFFNESGICYGVDMNRNFAFEWKGAGHNFDVPCDHWYGGQEPDSEPEVLALQSFINNTFDDDYIRIYLATHAYGNFLLLPYGHTSEVFPPNYEQLLRIAKGFAERAVVKHGTEYKYGASGLLNYPVAGAAKDWAYGIKKIPFTATVELRDNGTYGFFLPASQILETCEEYTDGIVGLLDAAANENLFD